MEDDIEDIKEPTEEISTTYTPPSDEQARWFFDYSRLYWEIKAHLYGGWLVEDKNGNYVIKKPKNAKPLLNTIGIEDTMAIINGFITKIQALTIIDEERIFIWCRELHIRLSQLYYINMEKYELTPEKASVIVRMIMNAFESNLRKSLGGMSMRLIGQTERIVEQRVEASRKKFLGII
jgi:hypothetical protein